jgi:hypothetical protein
VIERRPQYLFLSRVCTALIVISPMFSQYGGFIPHLLLPELLFIIVLPLCLIDKKRISLGRYKYILLYLAVILFLALIAALVDIKFSVSDFATAFLRYCFYIGVIIIVADRFFDITLGAKLLTLLGILNSLYLIAQYLSYTFFHTVLPWYIPGLPVSGGMRLIQNYEQIFRTYGFRPQGFFFEPAFFAYYVIPALALILFYKTPRFNYRTPVIMAIAFLYSVALLLSGSGNAIILLAFCWFLWGLQLLRGHNIPLLLVRSMLVILVVVFVGYEISQLAFVQRNIARTTSTDTMSTGNVRITRGFYVFDQLPTVHKVIGVGYGNYGRYLRENSVSTPFDTGGISEYTNTIAYVLVGTGVVGIGFYLLTYLDLFRKTKGFFRYRTLIVLATAFSGGNPISVSIVTAFAFIMSGYNVKENADINGTTALAKDPTG